MGDAAEQGLISSIFAPPKDKTFGELSVSGKTRVTGWATDPHGNLVGLQVVGGSTSVNAVRAAIYSGAVLTAKIDGMNRSAYAYTQTRSYRFAIRNLSAPGEKSPYFSLMVIEKTLFGLPLKTVDEYRQMRYAYVPYSDRKERVRRIVQSIITIPALEAWSDYIWEEGVIKGHCGLITPPEPGRPNYTNYCRGFYLAYVSLNDHDWEAVIQSGLKNGKISIKVNHGKN